VFLVRRPDTLELDFPASRPNWGAATRFVRVYASDDVHVDEVELQAERGPHGPYYSPHHGPHQGPHGLERTSLATLATRGVWAVDADFESRGAIPPRVPGAATVWFAPIAARARAAWARVRALTRPADVEPLAVYHGTTFAALAGIAARGFEAAPGMLGAAVYVGTPWKAVRYASRTADYALREQGAAVVVRAYLDVGRCKEFDGTGAACPCAACARTRATAETRARQCGWTPDFDRERTRVADHAGAWQLEGFDTAHVPVVVATAGSGSGSVARGAGAGAGAGAAGTEREDKEMRFVSRNEEWAVARPAERLWAQSAALLDMDTVAQPHWNPEQRDQQIL